MSSVNNNGMANQEKQRIIDRQKNENIQLKKDMDSLKLEKTELESILEAQRDEIKTNNKILRILLGIIESEQEKK